jgi:hypothetical protein
LLNALVKPDHGVDPEIALPFASNLVGVNRPAAPVVKPANADSGEPVAVLVVDVGML